ncbi:MAG: iron-sulfur cluster repair di-iron protein [Terracidiphilus sp.]
MIAAESTLRTIALAEPATIRVFENLHLDYCCGGNRPLGTACAEKGLDVRTVVDSLQAAAGTQWLDRDWAKATPTDLIEYIVLTHHAFVRAELPRLLPMAEKAATKHGPTHPELSQVQRQLEALADELLMHLYKEERILFPYIQSMEHQSKGQAPAAEACFGSVQSPIQMMIHEHEAAGTLLDEMRTATGGFAPWEGACPTLTGLYYGLDMFEKDLHRHVHLENNLLFPKAIEMEEQLMAAQ